MTHLWPFTFNLSPNSIVQPPLPLKLNVMSTSSHQHMGLGWLLAQYSRPRHTLRLEFRGSDVGSVYASSSHTSHSIPTRRWNWSWAEFWLGSEKTFYTAIDPCRFFNRGGVGKMDLDKNTLGGALYIPIVSFRFGKSSSLIRLRASKLNSGGVSVMEVVP